MTKQFSLFVPPGKKEIAGQWEEETVRKKGGKIYSRTIRVSK